MVKNKLWFEDGEDIKKQLIIFGENTTQTFNISMQVYHT